MESNKTTTTSEVVAKVLIEIPGIPVYRLFDNTRKQFCEGTLRIAELTDQEVYFLNVDEFYYTIQKDCKFIIIPFADSCTIIFPHTESIFTALSIPTNSELDEQLYDILSNICTMQYKYEVLQDESLHAAIDAHCKNIFEVPLGPGKAVQMINQGGSLIKQGFSWIGSVVSRGYHASGDYLSSKLSDTKEEKQKITDDTREKFEQLKNRTKTTMKVRGDALTDKTHRSGKTTGERVGEEVSDKVDKADKKIGQWKDDAADKIDKLGNKINRAKEDAADKIENTETKVVKKAKEYGKECAEQHQHNKKACKQAREEAQRLGQDISNKVGKAEKKFGEDVTNTVEQKENLGLNQGFEVNKKNSDWSDNKQDDKMRKPTDEKKVVVQLQNQPIDSLKK